MRATRNIEVIPNFFDCSYLTLSKEVLAYLISSLLIFSLFAESTRDQGAEEEKSDDLPAEWH